MNKPKPFHEWLQEQIDRQPDLNVNRLSIAAGVEPSTIHKVLDGYRNAGPELCRGLATALGIPQWKVFMAAGLIDEQPRASELLPLDPDLARNIRILENMNAKQAKLFNDLIQVVLNMKDDPKATSRRQAQTSQQSRSGTDQLSLVK
jgi:hypothetical protein